jgi:hypothetical protein
VQWFLVILQRLLMLHMFMEYNVFSLYSYFVFSEYTDVGTFSGDRTVWCHLLKKKKH